MNALVFRPGDAEYDAERTGFQLFAPHQPAVVVAATSAADVQEAVSYAAAENLPIAVQATGHGLTSALDGGVLINTSRMSGFRIDVESQTAWIEAGVQWKAVIEAAAAHGLAPLSGSSPSVGAVSYTLNGGIGVLVRSYGLAADQVRVLEVVTADGQLQRVTAGSELFWALLGGGNNFGVVTGMEIGLVPVSRLYGGTLSFDGARAAEVFEAYHRWTASVPDDITSSVALVPYPELPMIPEALRGRLVAQIRIASVGDKMTGERLVAPLREIAPLLMDTLEEMPFTDAGKIFSDPPNPHAYYGTSVFLDDLDKSAIEELLELTGPDAEVPCVVQLNHLGAAVSKAGPNAVGHRDARYVLRLISSPDGPARAHHDRIFAALGSFASGRALTFMFGRTNQEQVRSGFDADTYERLVALKGSYDPANLFRANNNLAP